MRFWPWTHPQKPARVEPEEHHTHQPYDQYDAYSKLLDRNGRWIEVADTKAAVILGVVMATFPVLMAPAFPVARRLWGALPPQSNGWALLLFTAFMALMVAFVGAALWTFIRVMMTLKPRLSRAWKPGVVFFADIARLDCGVWQSHIRAMSPDELAHQMLEQVYATASIAEVKHRYVQQAVRGVLWVVLLGCTLYTASLLLAQVIR